MSNVLQAFSSIEYKVQAFSAPYSYLESEYHIRPIFGLYSDPNIGRIWGEYDIRFLGMSRVR